MMIVVVVVMVQLCSLHSGREKERDTGGGGGGKPVSLPSRVSIACFVLPCTDITFKRFLCLLVMVLVVDDDNDDSSDWNIDRNLLLLLSPSYACSWLRLVVVLLLVMITMTIVINQKIREVTRVSLPSRVSIACLVLSWTRVSFQAPAT